MVSVHLLRGRAGAVARSGNEAVMPRVLVLLCLSVTIGCASSSSPQAELTKRLRGDLSGLRTRELSTPSPSRTHRVRRGETLWSIARRWGVTVADLKQANGLTGDTIYAGQELVIPGGGVGPSEQHRTTDSTGPAWPVPGLRQARRDGDALVIYTPEGTSVVAAAGGRVNYVSEQVRGLGAVVMLEHPGGVLTFYGRLGEVAVRLGQSVGRGAPLGRVAPGGEAGPRLRFMVFKDGKAVSAGDYLAR